jgi:hypothetical protein
MKNLSQITEIELESGVAILSILQFLGIRRVR